MYRTGYMPTKDAEFIAWAKNIRQQCAANQTAWGLNAADVSKLNALTDAANSAYEDNANPESANHRTVANKNFTFSELKHFISSFTSSFYANSAISEADLMAMRLRPREHHAHQPIPVPEETPEVVIRSGTHGEILIYVSTPSLGQPDRSLTQGRYHGFQLRWRIDGDTEWHTEVSTRLHTALHFAESDCAKYVTLQAAWLNPRIQAGPWSAEVKALVN